MPVFLFCFAFFVDNAKYEEKDANEKKQTPEENLPKAFPIKLKTPKSSQGTHHVPKKLNEISPFSKLYENLKNELKVEKPLPRGAASQQTANGGPGRALPEPSVPISSLACLDLGSLAEGKESGRRENTEECPVVRKGGGSPGFNQLPTAGRTPRKSFPRSPRTPIAKEVSGETAQSPLQDPKGLRNPGSPRGAAATPKPSTENHSNSLQQCSIERMYCSAKEITGSPTTPTSRPAAGRQGVLATPTPRRRSPRSLFVSPPKEATAVNPGDADAPKTSRRGSLKLKCLPEIPAGAPGEESVCRIDNTQLPLPEEKCLKQRRNSKQQTPRKPVQEVLKEIWDQANLDNSKRGHCETPTSFSNSRSLRRNSRQSKEFLDKSVSSEALAPEGVAASPAAQTPGSGRKRGSPRTSGVRAETALERNSAQEHCDSGRKASGTAAELAMAGCHHTQDLQGASAARPRRSSANRGSAGIAAEMGVTEPGSETKTSALLHGENSGKSIASPALFFILEKFCSTFPRSLPFG